MRASLADQGLAIALGANLPSPVGEPVDTLLAVRPLLEERLEGLGERLRWSPLFRTAPVGGPSSQPHYLNAVLLLQGATAPDRPPTAAEAARLLADLQALEERFGRKRQERWGPRSLDLDLLWWGQLQCRSPHLELPHPRLAERAFVLAPLAAIDAALVPPGGAAAAAAGELLSQLPAAAAESAPHRLVGQPGWPE